MTSWSATGLAATRPADRAPSPAAQRAERARRVGPPVIPGSRQAWVQVERYVKPVIVLTAALVLSGSLVDGRLWAFDTLIPDTFAGKLFWTTTGGYGLIMLAALAWRVALWLRYRPMLSVPDGELPSASVLIPVFNEGSLVRHAILSAAASRYPAHKLEIIVIDDGSTDDTWQHICSAAAEVQEGVKVTTLRQPWNTGKRRALYLGFERARGDVFVTMDSDSVLDPEALRNVVTPLVRDPAIGCVAGCVQVLNPRESLMTRFLKCYFSMSFKYVRAYQNEFRGVFCTPGALSAYRAEAVRRFADEWVTQRFLGQTCTTGEDRAMTNVFLREGWMTAYQGNAVVWSKMPHTYAGLTRMFLRWARSNIRETIFLYGFLFTRFRQRRLTAFRVNMMLVLLSLVLPPLLVFNNLGLLAISDGFLLHRTSVITVFAAVLAAIYYRNERDSDWVWLLVYKFFWVTCLFWILPYAAMTLRNTGWLTRRTIRPAGAGADSPRSILCPATG